MRVERRLTMQAITQTAAKRWERTQLIRVDTNCQRKRITAPLTLVLGPEGEGPPNQCIGAELHAK
jgi:hypothetical protein